MCGIIAGVSTSDITASLLKGLKQLQYRGNDCAGLTLIDANGNILRKRSSDSLASLEHEVASDTEARGKIGIAYTRWGTQVRPNKQYTHAHIRSESIDLVHNGIIENHQTLRAAQEQMGYQFHSCNTDTEVIVHQLHINLDQSGDLFRAMQQTVNELQGIFSLVVISKQKPGCLAVAHHGSPLVIGLCDGENFIASDPSALIAKTRNYISLEDGDVACITTDSVRIVDVTGNDVEREVHKVNLTSSNIGLEDYSHYMQKEIHEQPDAVNDTLEGWLSGNQLLDTSFGLQANEIFKYITNVQIIACGSSYHAGLIARNWLEDLSGVPTSVEVASEFRYRSHVVPENCLILTISQSGETADTLAALKYARDIGYQHTLCVCNVAESTLTRESDIVLLTHAGPEIGIASTKTFTSQLVALMLVVIALGRHNALTTEEEERIVSQLRSLPVKISEALELDGKITEIADKFANKHHALFLGRASHYPVALEGALKLKEISYIHAEALPAGELKHGPLAMVDSEKPVIAVAPNDDLLEQIMTKIYEVRNRGGELIVFADPGARFTAADFLTMVKVASVDNILSPILYTIPLQLLAYRVALIKGTDIDNPRNLVKSVTDE
jgi:glucosamine--fructose-6-phosphate aminotransferase (isomerizing)